MAQRGFEIGAGITDGQKACVGGVEQGGVHGVRPHKGIADQRKCFAAVNHVGGKAVARGEVQRAVGLVAVVPAGLRGVQRGDRGQRQHLRAGCGGRLDGA